MQKLQTWDHGRFVALRTEMNHLCCAWLMLLAVILTVGLPQTASAEPLAAVDPALVGVWSQTVPNPLGVARWEMDIRSDGTFSFRSEGPGSPPSYTGTFQTTGGTWALRAPAINWSDGGAYELPTPNTFVMQGKLGTGTWKKINGTERDPSEHTQPSPAGSARGGSEVEPCSLVTLAEVSEVLNAPASMDRPHRVRRNNVTVGGDCVYRSAHVRTTLVTLHVDAYPGGHQRTALARRCQRPYTVDVSGVGDAACAEDPPRGPKSLTFLRGEVLVIITMTDPLGIAEAKALARRAIVRLSVPTAGSRTPSSPLPPCTSIPPGTRRAQAGSLVPAATFDPSGQPIGDFDPVLVGSWYLTQPSGPARANLTVRPDGVFLMEILASGRTQQGRIEGRNGVLRLRTEAGRVQEIRYQVIAVDRREAVSLLC